jgi:hypothetical protein
MIFAENFKYKATNSSCSSKEEILTGSWSRRWRSFSLFTGCTSVKHPLSGKSARMESRIFQNNKRSISIVQRSVYIISIGEKEWNILLATTKQRQARTTQVRLQWTFHLRPGHVCALSYLWPARDNPTQIHLYLPSRRNSSTLGG